MHQLQTLIVLIFGLFIASSALNLNDRVHMEPDVSVFSAPSWILGHRVTHDDTITVRFVLKHDTEKVSEFERYFLDISNPKSKNYGQWLSVDEVTEMIAPDERNVDIVKAFITSYGINDFYVNRNKDIIRIEISATIAELMFETVMHKFHLLDDEDTSVIRVIKPYSLPREVANVVSFVGELIRLPRLHLKKFITMETELTDLTESDSWNSCGTDYATFVNPAVLQERYGYPTLTSAATGNSVAVAEFQTQFYDDDDLVAFSSKCGLSTIEVTTLNGKNIQRFCKHGKERCIEALLDIEYIGAVAQPIPLSVYYLFSYSLYDWIEKVGDNDTPELVHSVSYGNDEAQQTSTDFMYSCNIEFMKIGARGVSILFASGDQGVWGREGTDGSVFHPDFPSGSPYITSVGGTDFAVKSVVGDETAWQSGGGGFSNTFAIPDYQSEAVAAFKANSTSLPASSYYNDTGRGYPDVSGLAGQQNSYFVSYKGGTAFTGVAGTSASSPVVAGIFAQLNDIRLKAGKASLGFLNQFIYQNIDAFNDVTSGTNSDGNDIGFTAIEGWDAATGVGTPNFDKLATLMTTI